MEQNYHKGGIVGRRADIIISDDVRPIGTPLTPQPEDFELKSLQNNIRRSERQLMREAGEHPRRADRTGTLSRYMDSFTDREMKILVFVINKVKQGPPIHAGMLPFVNKQLALEALTSQLSFRWWSSMGQDQSRITGRLPSNSFPNIQQVTVNLSEIKDATVDATMKMETLRKVVKELMEKEYEK